MTLFSQPETRVVLQALPQDSVASPTLARLRASLVTLGESILKAVEPLTSRERFVEAIHEVAPTVLSGTALKDIASAFDDYLKSGPSIGDHGLATPWAPPWKLTELSVLAQQSTRISFIAKTAHSGYVGAFAADIDALSSSYQEYASHSSRDQEHKQHVRRWLELVAYDTILSAFTIKDINVPSWVADAALDELIVRFREMVWIMFHDLDTGSVGFSVSAEDLDSDILMLSDRQIEFVQGVVEGLRSKGTEYDILWDRLRNMKYGQVLFVGDVRDAWGVVSSEMNRSLRAQVVQELDTRFGVVSRIDARSYARRVLLDGAFSAWESACIAMRVATEPEFDEEREILFGRILTAEDEVQLDDEVVEASQNLMALYESDPGRYSCPNLAPLDDRFFPVATGVDEAEDMAAGDFARLFLRMALYGPERQIKDSPFWFAQTDSIPPLVSIALTKAQYAWIARAATKSLSRSSGANSRLIQEYWIEGQRALLCVVEALYTHGGDEEVINDTISFLRWTKWRVNLANERNDERREITS